jgi:DNA-binding HxlR family transcriptional regulator
MSKAFRSTCPINLSLELLGDRWSLLVLRDVMFGDARTFRQLQGNSLEGIATNILADRLGRLIEAGLLTRRGDPGHKQKAIYSLTEAAIQLVPALALLAGWGSRHLPAGPGFAARAQALEDGGPIMWEAFMAELRHLHLGAESPKLSIRGHLDEVYAKADGPLPTSGERA